MTDKADMWGPLSHVSDGERAAILALPHGKFKRAVQKIEKQLAEEAKERKRQEKEAELRRKFGVAPCPRSSRR